MSIDTTPVRVAVIEDSPEFLTAVETFLSELPGAVLAGTSAAADDAIQLLRNCRPDLVLLDVFLAHGTGLDVLRRLQAKGNQTMTIVMTGTPSPELKALCLALGASQFVDKAELLEWLPEVIDQARRSISAD